MIDVSRKLIATYTVTGSIQDIDPNTSLVDKFVTNNTTRMPSVPGVTAWYIETTFYLTPISATSSRKQRATSYNAGPYVYERNYTQAQGWTGWKRVDNGATTSTAGPSGGVDGDVWYKV